MFPSQMTLHFSHKEYNKNVFLFFRPTNQERMRCKSLSVTIILNRIRKTKRGESGQYKQDPEFPYRKRSTQGWNGVIKTKTEGAGV